MPFGLLAPGVVGHRLVERGGQVRAGADHLVVDGDGVGDTREPAGARGAQAKQPDQIGAVGVVIERDAAELVAAHRRVVDRLALVGHVAQHVAVLVLRPRRTEMQPDSPVEEREVVVAVARRVQRGDAGEAPPVEQHVDDAVELGGEALEGEVVSAQLERVAALRLGHLEGRVELGVVLGLEMQRPRLRVGHVGGPPLGRRLQLVQFARRHAVSFPFPEPPRTSRPGSAPVGSPSRYVTCPSTTVAQ